MPQSEGITSPGVGLSSSMKVSRRVCALVDKHTYYTWCAFAVMRIDITVRFKVVRIHVINVPMKVDRWPEP